MAGTFRIFDKVMKQWGLDATFMDMSDPAKVKAALRPSTKLVWLETPSNPMLKIVDIAAIAGVAKKHGAALAVDNTFATPIAAEAASISAPTMVVHSTTKYLNGHSDVVGGAVITSDEAQAEKLHFLQKSVGGVPSPFDCYTGAPWPQDARRAA